MVVLDTNILVDFLRNNEEVVNKIKSYYDSDLPVMTTSITLFELFRGAYASHNPEKKISDIELLIEDIDILYFDVKSSKIVGKIYNELKKHGKTIGILDQLIAGIVISNNEKLVTGNIKEFSRIPDLKIEKW